MIQFNGMSKKNDSNEKKISQFTATVILSMCVCVWKISISKSNVSVVCRVDTETLSFWISKFEIIIMMKINDCVSINESISSCHFDQIESNRFVFVFVFF